MLTLNCPIYSLADLKNNPKILGKCVDFIISNVMDDWDWYVLDEIQGLLKNIGFETPRICYSGFYSQGDGASFLSKEIDNYKLVSFAAGVYINDEIEQLAKNICHYPEPELIRLLKLADSFSSYIERINHYYVHERTTVFKVESYVNHNHKNINKLIDKFEDHFKRVVLNLNKHIYSLLEKDYEHVTKTENIIDNYPDYYFNNHGQFVGVFEEKPGSTVVLTS